jgi:hypothetical protein
VGEVFRSRKPGEVEVFQDFIFMGEKALCAADFVEIGTNETSDTFAIGQYGDIKLSVVDRENIHSGPIKKTSKDSISISVYELGEDAEEIVHLESVQRSHKGPIKTLFFENRVKTTLRRAENLALSLDAVKKAGIIALNDQATISED